MSSNRTHTENSSGDAPLDGYPTLVGALGVIRHELAARNELGLLSVTVLRRSQGFVPDSWTGYEQILTEIHHFVEGRFPLRCFNDAGFQ